MKYELLTRRELEIINRQNFRYPLAIAEKDYLLAVVSKIIYNSPLREKVVFKGGTAIHHCFLPQSRFSEDLDFSSLDKSVALEEVKAVLESQDFLEVKKDYVSKATIKIERLKYAGPLALPNSLKVEIDFLQNVVLPPNDIIYKNPWKVDTKVRVMDIKEICAEKIRAANERSRYRDFYDLFLILKEFEFSMEEIIDLITQKEIRKTINKKLMLSNLKNALKEKEGELNRVYYAKDINEKDLDDMIKSLPLELIGLKNKNTSLERKELS